MRVQGKLIRRNPKTGNHLLCCGKSSREFAALARGVRVRRPNFLFHVPLLRATFRQHLRGLFEQHPLLVDPRLWRLA